MSRESSGKKRASAHVDVRTLRTETLTRNEWRHFGEGEGRLVRFLRSRIKLDLSSERTKNTYTPRFKARGVIVWLFFFF